MQVIGWESSYDLLEILEELNVTQILMYFFRTRSWLDEIQKAYY